MATPVHEGTATGKASTTSITLEDITTELNECLLAVISFKGTNLPTEVAYGLRDMSRVAHRIDSTNEFGIAVYGIRNIGKADTRDIVATWASAIDAKILSAITLDVGHTEDQKVNSLDAASTAPSVGPTDALSNNDEFALGILHCEGATNDTEPTLSAGWTKLFRDGTVGVPPASNQTILVAYQNVTTTDALTLSGTGATERNWCNLLVTFDGQEIYTTDYNGSRVFAGDTVEYKGSTYTVANLVRGRNIVNLTGVGLVSAVECEVKN